MLHAHPIRVTTLTPFNYGHLAVDGGVATIPNVLGDRAIAFALCAGLGMMRASCKLPDRNYRGHLASMPWRTSVLVNANPVLLPPLARRSDLGVEGGYPSRVERAARSGNFKEFFSIQEVPHEQDFLGCVFGADPFEIAEAESFVVRIGSNRTGMARIERGTQDDVTLNAATAHLFGRQLPVARYMLHELQLTGRMSLQEAAAEVSRWN